MRAACLVCSVLVGCSPSTSPVAACADEVAVAEGGQALVYDLAWSPSSEHIVTGATAALRMYEVDDDGLQEVWRDTSDYRFNSVVFGPDGRLHAPTGTTLRTYEPAGRATSLVGEVVLTEAGRDLQRIDVSSDGERLLACDTAGDLIWVDLTADPPAVLDRLWVHQRCTRVDVSPSGALALSTGHDGDVVLTSVEGDALAVLDRFPLGGESGEARFGVTDAVAYAGGFVPPFALWHLAVDDGALVPIASHLEHRAGIGSIDFDPTGRWLVTGDHDYAVRLYQINLGGQLTYATSLPIDGRGVHSARFAPDGSLLARTASNTDELALFELAPCLE